MERDIFGAFEEETVDAPPQEEKEELANNSDGDIREIQEQYLRYRDCLHEYNNFRKREREKQRLLAEEKQKEDRIKAEIGSLQGQLSSVDTEGRNTRKAAPARARNLWDKEKEGRREKLKEQAEAEKKSRLQKLLAAQKQNETKRRDAQARENELNNKKGDLEQKIRNPEAHGLLSAFWTSEKEYRAFSWKIVSITGLACFLILLLEAMKPGRGIFFILTLLVLKLADAGLLFHIYGWLVKKGAEFFKWDVDLKDSAAGLPVWLAAFATHLLSPYFRNSWFDLGLSLVVCGVLAVIALLAAFTMKELLNNFLVKKAVAGLLALSAKNGARQRVVAGLRTQLQDTEKELEGVRMVFASVESEAEALKVQRDDIVRQNGETDQKLQKALAMEDQKPVPDFENEANFLPKDRDELDRLRKQWSAIRKDLQNRQGELTAPERESRIRAIRQQLSDLRDTIDECERVIRGWMWADEETYVPMLERDTAEFDQWICICDPADEKEPFNIVRHHICPMVFRYRADGWREEAGVNLISRIWRGFIKTVPPELLNISVADPGRLVFSKIGSMAPERMGFVRSCQKGYAPAAGAAAGKTALKNMTRVLFEEQDIGRLDKELQDKQDDIQDYTKVNYDRILKAKKGLGDKGDRLTEIGQVNVCSLEYDRPPRMRPYHIVIFMIPQETGSQSWSRFSTDRISYLAGLVGRGNYADFGVIPVLLAPDDPGRIHPQWQGLVEGAGRAGVEYDVDLETLRIRRR